MPFPVLVSILPLVNGVDAEAGGVCHVGGLDGLSRITPRSGGTHAMVLGRA